MLCAYLLEAGIGESGGAASSCKRRLRARAAPAWICSLDPSIRAPDHPTNPAPACACSPRPPQRRRQQRSLPLAAGSRRRAHKLFHRRRWVRRKAKERHKCLPTTHRYAPRAKSNTHSHTKHPCRCRVYMQFILLRATLGCALKIQESRKSARYSLYIVCGFFMRALIIFVCGGAQVEIKISHVYPDGESCDRHLDPFHHPHNVDA